MSTPPTGSGAPVARPRTRPRAEGDEGKAAVSAVRVRRAADAITDDDDGPRGCLPSSLGDVLKPIFLLALLGLIILLVDGARREYSEFFANLAAFQPVTRVSRAQKEVKAEVNLHLKNKDIVVTGPQGQASIAFPDGSAVRVEPNTRFDVELLDYSRGPKRDRSFLLRGGAVFMRISKTFGPKGQTLIRTPNAVAAARGTGFTVQYLRASNTTIVEVVDGKVALRNAGGRVEISVGQRGIAVGNRPPTLDDLAPNRQQVLLTLFNNLRQRYDQPPGPAMVWVMGAERRILNFLNPALQTVGLTPGGFNLGETDAGRRLAARRALQLLQQEFEGQNGDAPELLNPITLEELGITPESRETILSAFAGYTIDRYERVGQNGYHVVVRARDGASTVFELTEDGVRQVP